MNQRSREGRFDGVYEQSPRMFDERARAELHGFSTITLRKIHDTTEIPKLAAFFETMILGSSKSPAYQRKH